jgi:hypothetical protein
MATSSTAKKRVMADDEQVQRLVELLRTVDTTELKLSVPEADHISTARSLGMDPLQAQLRQVFFFDTPDLALERSGVVVRARRTQGKPDDTVVKLRPVVPDEMPRKLRRDPLFGIEVDVSPEGFVCSGSLKGVAEAGRALEAARGERSLAKLLTRDQRDLYEAHAPAGVGLADLVVLGPILVLKLKYAPSGYGRRLVSELWLYPDGSRILELSTKCAPSEAFQVAAETRAFLNARGVDLSADQQTKTRSALELFSRALQQREPEAAAATT